MTMLSRIHRARTHPLVGRTLRRLSYVKSPDQIIVLDYPARPTPRYGYGKPPHSGLRVMLERNREQYRETLTGFLDFRDALAAIPTRETADPTAPCWANRWLPGLDAVALYGLIARNRPKRYLEIGSGVSTRFARRAIADQRLPTTITSIDPQPRAEIDAICDRMHRARLEDVDLACFDELESGDIVFFDGSHRCFSNSDVAVFFLEVTPRLRPGVLVQIHDIYLPDDYPPAWNRRFYSEQQMLAVYLMGSGDRAGAIEFPSWFISQDADLRANLGPLWSSEGMRGVETHGGSFWFRTV